MPSHLYLLSVHIDPHLSSKGLSIPVSHDENAHHVVPQNPYWVLPPPVRIIWALVLKGCMAVTQCLPTLQPQIFAKLTLCWPRLHALLPRKHAEHVQFPIGILSTVMNSFLSSFPKLTYNLMSSGNLIYFRRLYLMCLSTCSMKPIILLTVVTILLNQWSQPTEMHLATQYPWFQFPLIKFLVLSQKVEP